MIFIADPLHKPLESKIAQGNTYYKNSNRKDIAVYSFVTQKLNNENLILLDLI